MNDSQSLTYDMMEANRIKKGCGYVICADTDYDGKMVICGKYGNILCDKCKLELVALQENAE